MEEDQKRFIERGSHKGKGLAVFTSGGDSQGTYYIISKSFFNLLAIIKFLNQKIAIYLYSEIGGWILGNSGICN